MKYFVCLKQVPDTRDIQCDPITGSLLRDTVGSIPNPNDEDALNAVLELREKTGGNIAAITMGPKQAKATLRNALSLGVDEAYHMMDSRFSGADVYVTAYTLAQGIKKVGMPEVILCGKQSIDGDTGQVGAELAEILGYAHVYYVTEILEATETYIVVKSKVGVKIREIKVLMPAVISTDSNVFQKRVSSFRDKILAQKKVINVLTIDDLEDNNRDHYGYRASPTKVKEMYVPSVSRICKFTSEVVWEDLLNRLKEDIRDERMIGVRTNKDDVIKAERRDGKLAGSNLRDNNLAESNLDEKPTSNIRDEKKNQNNKKNNRLCIFIEEDTTVGKEIANKVAKYKESKGLSIDGVLVMKSNCNLANIEEYSMLDRLYIYSFQTDYLTTEHYVKGINEYLQVDNQEPPSILLIGGTPLGRSFAPRIAAKYKTGITADCIDIDIDHNFLLEQIRPAYSEALLAKIITPDTTPQIATIRPGTFHNPSHTDLSQTGINQNDLSQTDLPQTNVNQAEIYKVLSSKTNFKLTYIIHKCKVYYKGLELRNQRIKVITEEILSFTEDHIQNSKIVVLVGNAIKEYKDLELITRFAKSINASVGVTRPLVQGGLADHSKLVGISGVNLNCKIAILVGVSGSNQTLAGLKKVKKIIAINNDEQANIFNYADIGIIKDWKEVI